MSTEAYNSAAILMAAERATVSKLTFAQKREQYDCVLRRFCTVETCTSMTSLAIINMCNSFRKLHSVKFIHKITAVYCRLGYLKRGTYDPVKGQTYIRTETFKKIEFPEFIKISAKQSKELKLCRKKH